MNKLCKVVLVLLVMQAFQACIRVGLDDSVPTDSFCFKVVPKAFTKSGEFTDNKLSSNASLFMVASICGENGQVEIPSLFMDGNDPAAAQMEYVSGTTWKINNQDIFFPLGNHSMNFIAYGVDADAGGSIFSDFSNVWKPTFNATDVASTVVFEDVETYYNQMDMMYGAANRIYKDNATANISLSHSQAQLVFNVKFEGNQVDFIESNDTYYKFKLDDILFVDDDGMNEYLNSDPVTAGHITLKTKGTFTINNTGNVLKGDWSSLETVEGAYAVPMGTPPATPLVSNNHAESSPVFTNTQGSWKRSDIIRGKIYQVGHPLLVPEQPTQSILVMYTYENVQYYSRLNVPQSVWQSGHTYIYTLVFNNGIGLTLHLTAQAASWDDVAPNSCSLGVETKLSLESFVYRRYDEDDDLSTWDDSYVAVAYGKDRYGFPMCSSLMSLETTSTGSGLRLISDNDKFKFVQNVSNDTPVATLDISAGTDVKTYFYIVPADSYDISTLSDDERKANIYLMDIDNGTYISFNPGVFPSNDTYTSCKIYMVSYDDYFSGWSSKHLYNEPS